MKKQWIALAVAVLLLLAGCSTNTMSELKEPPPTNNEETAYIRY